MAERDPQIRSRRTYPAYEADYSAWVLAQATLLQEGRFAELDVENLVDEVESLSRSDYAAFVSAIEIVLIQMLKWDVQPERRGPSWVASIVEHRRRIVRALKQSPSFRSRLEEAVEEAFETATARAAGETNLPLSDFPEQNPFDWEDITTRSYELPTPVRRNRKNA